MNRWKVFSDLRLLIAFLFLLVLLPEIALFTARFHQEREDRTRKVHDEIRYYAELIAQQDQQVFESARNLLMLLARAPQLEKPKSCSPFLKELIVHYPRYNGFAVADLSGNMRCNAGPLPLAPINLHDPDYFYFREAIKSAEFSVGRFAIGRRSGTPVLHFAYPIVSRAGNVQAVILASMPVAQLHDFSGIVPPAERDRYTLTKVDESGKVLVHFPVAGQWVIGDKAPELQIVNNALGDATKVFTGSKNGKEQYIYASTPIQTFAAQNHVHVIVGVSQSLVTTEINQTFRRSLFSVLLVSLLGLVLAMTVAYVYVLRPVASLIQTATNWEVGNWKTRSGVPYQRAQLGGLARAFDTMAEAIEQRAKERQAAEARFKQILEDAPDARVLVDPTGRVELVNLQTESLFGYSRSELIGRPVETLISESHRHRHLVLRTNLGVRPSWNSASKGFEFFGLRKDKTEFPVEITLSHLNMDDGTLASLAIRDITDRKQAQKTLETTALRLRLLAQHLQTVREEERSRIARDIHDELGQSLSGLKMELYSIYRRLPNSDASLTERAQASLERVDEIIRNVQRTSAELHPRALDLGLLTAIEWQAEEFQSRSGMSCEMELPSSEIPLERQQSLALYRIVQEALTNVARHSCATEAKISLTQEDGKVLLEIVDNGKGLNGNGSGLHSFGITSMQERAEVLGGTFTIESTRDKGTTVRVKMPVTSS
jgi:PAS domain S-box-containing protein